MIWWLLLAASLAFFAWLWYLGTKPAINDMNFPNSVAMALEQLTRRGVHGASLTVLPRGDTKIRVEVVKYIKSPGDVGLRSVVEDSNWNPRELEKLEEELKSRGIPHDVVRRGKGVQAVKMDFGRDVGLAHLFLKIAFGEILGMRIETECVSYFRDVLPRDNERLTGVRA